MVHDGIEETIDANDDWGSLPSEDKSIIVDYVRYPGRSTDAAWVGTVSNTAICVHAFEYMPSNICLRIYAFEYIENGPAGKINLQINHIDYQ